LGTVVASTDIRPDDVTPSNFEEVHDAFSVANNWNTVEGTVRPESARIDTAKLYGGLDESEHWEHSRGNIISFAVRSADGDVLRFSLEDDSVTVHRYGENSEEADDIEIPEWTTVHFVGVCLMVSMRAVDQFIDKNGLRPVVGEVERRKWAIMMALALLTAVSQTGGL
jgi:hypothetical protein